MAKRAIACEMELDIRTVREQIGTEWKPQRRQREEPAPAKHDEWIRNRFPEPGYGATVVH